MSPADSGVGLTPRRHTLSSRIAIMCSGPDGTGAQHPPGPRPRRAHAEPASSSLRLFLTAPAGGTATTAISRPPAQPWLVTWPPAGSSRGFGSDLLGPQLPGTPPGPRQPARDLRLGHCLSPQTSSAARPGSTDPPLASASPAPTRCNARAVEG